MDTDSTHRAEDLCAFIDASPSPFHAVATAATRLEAAGFTEDDDELPDFFYEDALEPSNKVARFHAAEVNESVRRWWQQHAV